MWEALMLPISAALITNFASFSFGVSNFASLWSYATFFVSSGFELLHDGKIINVKMNIAEQI